MSKLRFLFVNNNEDMFDMDYIVAITRPDKNTIVLDKFGNSHSFETEEKNHTAMCEKFLKYQLFLDEQQEIMYQGVE